MKFLAANFMKLAIHLHLIKILNGISVCMVMVWKEHQKMQMETIILKVKLDLELTQVLYLHFSDTYTKFNLQ